jgi:hypothetical protein
MLLKRFFKFQYLVLNVAINNSVSKFKVLFFHHFFQIPIVHVFMPRQANEALLTIINLTKLEKDATCSLTRIKTHNSFK